MRWPLSHRSAATTRAALALAILLVAGCAKSDAAYLAELEHRDPFRRTLAALALAKQAPQHASQAVPVLLQGVDRVGLGLSVEVQGALDALAPLAAEDLVRALTGDPFMTLERSTAIREALVAGGAAVAPTLVAAVRGSGPEFMDEFRPLLVAQGAEAVPALVSVLADESSSPHLSAWAARTLGEIGPNARAALPALRAAATSGTGEHDDLKSYTVRPNAAEAIRRIEGSAGE